MKKKILTITGIFAGISIMISIFFGYRYFHSYNIGKEYKSMDELIIDIRSERKRVKQKMKQLEEMKKKNQDKASLLELWQREKEKVEKR